MKKTIETLVRSLIYCSFFVPLVIMPTSFIFPFIVPKILMFRTITICLLAGYTLLMLSNWKEYRPKITPLSGALLVFLLSFAISTFVGLDSYHSFWDNHERMLGLFTITHYIIYFFVLNATIKNWTSWKSVARVFLLAGSVVMAIAVLQVANPTLLLNQGSERVIGTLGNAIYVGGYGMFLFFLSALLYLRETSVLWKWIEICTGLLALGGLYYSGTRGSLLGLFAGVYLAMVLYLVLLKEHKRVRIALGTFIFLGLAIVGVLFSQRTSSFVTDSFLLNRIFNSAFRELTTGPRSIAWKAAVESWKERPVFGWGPNNFYYAFNKYYDPQLLEYGYGETWFDNAHNIILNTLTVQGLVGLISYLAIFAASVVVLARAYKAGTVNIHVFVVGVAFLAAHLVGNATVFENPTSYLYFMFWLAMINQLSQKAEPVVEGKTVLPSRNVSGLQVGVAGAFALIANLIFNLEPALANINTLKTIQALNVNPIAAMDQIKVTLSESSPHIDDIRNDISRHLVEMVSGNYQKIGVEKSMQLLSIADDASQKNVSLHPYDIRVHLLIAQLNQVALQITNQGKFLTASEDFTQKALVESPRRQQIIFSLANVKLQLGKNDEAIALLRGTLNDAPTIAETYWRLIVSERIAEHLDKVKEVHALAIKNNIVFKPEEQDIINRVLQSLVTTTQKAKK